MAIPGDGTVLQATVDIDHELTQLQSFDAPKNRLETIDEPTTWSLNRSNPEISSQPVSQRPSRRPSMVPSRVASRTASRAASPTPGSKSASGDSSTDVTEQGDRPTRTVDMMASWLYLQQRNSEWLRDMNPAPQGVLLKNGWDKYVSMPLDLVDSVLGYNCAVMNVRVSIVPWSASHLGPK